MGKRKYQDVGAVDSVVIEHVWEALKTNTVEPITKDLPSVGMGRNPFHGLVDFFSKFEPQPGTAALVPNTGLSVFLRSEPMEANFGFKHSAAYRSSFRSDQGTVAEGSFWASSSRRSNSNSRSSSLSSESSGDNVSSNLSAIILRSSADNRRAASNTSRQFTLIDQHLQKRRLRSLHSTDSPIRSQSLASPVHFSSVAHTRGRRPRLQGTSIQKQAGPERPSCQIPSKTDKFGTRIA